MSMGTAIIMWAYRQKHTDHTDHTYLTLVIFQTENKFRK